MTSTNERISDVLYEIAWLKERIAHLKSGFHRHHYIQNLSDLEGELKELREKNDIH